MTDTIPAIGGRTNTAAYPLDKESVEDVYRFAMMELEFMHPDVMVDNVMRRGDFAPGGPGDPERRRARRG